MFIITSSWKSNVQLFLCKFTWIHCMTMHVILSWRLANMTNWQILSWAVIKIINNQQFWVWSQYQPEHVQALIFVVGVGYTRHHPTAVPLVRGCYGPPGLSLYIYTTPIAIKPSKKHKSHHFTSYWKRNLFIT